MQNMLNKLHVFVVEGLGFGDDEDVWEFCSMHNIQAKANAARDKILAADPELPRDGVRVRCVKATDVQA